MPQMSPMLWIVFPLVMMGLIIIGVVIINVDLLVNSEESWFTVNVMEMKW